MSPRRFNGWEPQEVHTHYDTAGTVTGTTVVAREAEWDEETQTWAVEHLRFESAVCKSCGTHYTQGHRRDIARNVEQFMSTCEDCRAIEMERDVFHKDHGHTDDSCDCDSRTFFVESYLPIP